MALVGGRYFQVLARHPQCLKTLMTLSRNIFPSANALHEAPSLMHLHECRAALDIQPYFMQLNQKFSSSHHDDDESIEVKESQFENQSPALSAESKEKEASEIGYRVIGPLEKSDGVFKGYLPVFAVVQIGSHQFKVSSDDCIYTERLKYCNINDKLLLNKVLLLGSKTQTIIGRPILPNAAVHAVVEEHALDAKVIVFKKKRRKNYRRTKGHRQELTKLRITSIEGIEVPESDTSMPLKKEKKQKPEILSKLKLPRKKDGLRTPIATAAA